MATIEIALISLNFDRTSIKPKATESLEIKFLPDCTMISQPNNALYWLLNEKTGKINKTLTFLF